MMNLKKNLCLPVNSDTVLIYESRLFSQSIGLLKSLEMLRCRC